MTNAWPPVVDALTSEETSILPDAPDDPTQAGVDGASIATGSSGVTSTL